MFCKKCGAEIPEGKNFCADCGTPVIEKNNGKKNKIVLIIVACIAIIAIVCAAVFGFKLMGKKDSEQTTTSSSATETTLATTTSTTAPVTTVPTTVETTSAASTTVEPTAKTTTKKAVNTTKKQTKPATTKAQNSDTNSDGLVVGKKYKKIPINAKTKNLRVVGWRGFFYNCSDDMEVTVKYDKDYNVDMLSVEYHKPSLKSSLFKSMTLTYRSNGEAVISASTYLGAYNTYTEEEFISRMGADGALQLELLKIQFSDMLFLDPLAFFEEYQPESTGDYEYKGKETLKSGETYKFDVYCPDTGETIYIWVDAKNGTLAKMMIDDMLFVEASEIKPD